MLNTACTYGDPLIITNAAKGWVEYSSKHFLPRVHATLREKKIRIISARSNYEQSFPGDASRWKREAFLEISKEYIQNVREGRANVTNIICVGDSEIEMEAAKSLAK